MSNIELQKKTSYQIDKIDLRNNLAIPLTPSENRVFNAIVSTKIRDYDPDKFFENVGDLFENISRDAGIPFNMDPVVISRISDILITYYGHLTLNEIKMAFELAFVGKLNNYLPKKNGEADLNHYQRLSLDYISKIINGYIKYKGRFLEKISENQKPNYEEIRNNYKSLIIERFEAYRKDGSLPGIVLTYTAEYLGKYKLIKIPKMRHNKEGAMVREYLDELAQSVAGYFDELIREGKHIKDLIDEDK